LTETKFDMMRHPENHVEAAMGSTDGLLLETGNVEAIEQRGQ